MKESAPTAGPSTLISVLSLCWLLSAVGATRTAGAQQGILRFRRCCAAIRALITEKESRTPAQKIDSQLLYAMKMSRGDQIAAAVPTSTGTHSADNKVIVDIHTLWLCDRQHPCTGQEILTVVAGYHSVGRTFRSCPRSSLRCLMSSSSSQNRVYQGRAAAGIPVPRMSQLSHTTLAEPPVKSIAPLVGSHNRGTRHTKRFARATFGSMARGGIGVISDVTSSPSVRLQVTKFVTVLPGQQGAGDEERLCSRSFRHCPGAQLFATGRNGFTFAQNIRDLRTAGCDIIIDDVGFFVETPFQDGQAPGVISTTNGGVVIQAVNDVTASGALYFSAAGNEGNIDDGTAGCWEGDFKDGGTIPAVAGGRVHDFGGGAQSNLITVSAPFPIVLFWSDPLGGSANDYDIFVLDGAGAAVLASSTNIQSGTQDHLNRWQPLRRLPGDALLFFRSPVPRFAAAFSTPSAVDWQ